MTAKPCPNCGSNTYIYGWDFFKSMSSCISPETLLAVASGNYAKVVTKANFGIIKAFYNELIEGIPSTPLLRCHSCKSYILPCPSCHEFLLIEKYANIGDVFECNRCKSKISICETNSDCDRFVKY